MVGAEEDESGEDVHAASHACLKALKIIMKMTKLYQIFIPFISFFSFILSPNISTLISPMQNNSMKTTLNTYIYIYI